MLLRATIFVDFATVAGGLAGAIAVMGFVFQAVPVLRGAGDSQVRWATAVGGLGGLLIGVVILLSTYFR
jgi:hypothetical protein